MADVPESMTFNQNFKVTPLVGKAIREDAAEAGQTTSKFLRGAAYFGGQLVRECPAVTHLNRPELAELAARGVPAILIPYPYAAENHQEKNARAVEAAGAAEVILNRDLSGAVLEGALRTLLADEVRRAAMAAAMKRLGKPEAAERIAALALRIAKREG